MKWLYFKKSSYCTNETDGIMRPVTKNLVLFIVVFSVLTFLMRAGVSFYMFLVNIRLVWAIIAAYILFSVITGLLFGRNERKVHDAYPSGFRVHLVAYMIFCIISELWYHFGIPSSNENYRSLHIIKIFWGLGVFIHIMAFLIVRKNTVKK